MFGVDFTLVGILCWVVCLLWAVVWARNLPEEGLILCWPWRAQKGLPETSLAEDEQRLARTRAACGSLVLTYAVAVVFSLGTALLAPKPAAAVGLSTHLANALLNHTLKGTPYTPAATVYLGLSSTDPGAACTGYTEPTYTGYARKAIAFAAASSRSVAQSGTVTFDQDTSGSATVAYYVVADAITTSGGNILACGALSASKSIVAGNTPSVASGQVTVTVSAGYVSDYLANKWLDFALRNQTFTQPTHIYAALTTATISDSSTGSTLTEPSGNNYSRLSYDVWDAAASRATQNTSAMTFATPSGSWSTIVATALLDADTAGNLYFYDNGVVDQAVGASDTVRFVAGAFDISLN